ncbi:MAG: WXG100 family type VII secretion target [Candidatus Dormibacteraeota bacterium]|nr:WXG100 family type VII secretion target [Candidatus Dormibacteraeota bacterium]
MSLLGDPGSVRRQATALQQAGQSVEGLESVLSGQLRGLLGESWSGSAADAFAAHWSAESRQLSDLARVTQAIATTLETLAAELDTAQRLADEGRRVAAGAGLPVTDGGQVGLGSAIRLASPVVTQAMAQAQDLLDQARRRADGAREAARADLQGLTVPAIKPTVNLSAAQTWAESIAPLPPDPAWYANAAGWIGANNEQLTQLAIDAGMMVVGAQGVELGVGLDAGGLALDGTGVGAVLGVPADVAGTALAGASAGLAIYGAGRFGSDLLTLTKNTSGRDSNAVGATREQKVADLTGGKVMGDPGKLGLRVTEPNVGTTDVDVLGPNGEYIAVGGPAKAINVGDFGGKLRILRYAADQAGVPAQYYFAKGTPHAVLDLAAKQLGSENVFVFEE